MNETRGNARTKPTNNNTKNYLPPNDIGLREPLKEREMNSLKDTEKTNNVFNYYDISWLPPIEWSKPPKIIYYELRVWKYHNIISMHVFTTLKKAIKYYKKHNLSIKEENNEIFVEIIKINNLNPRYNK